MMMTMMIIIITMMMIVNWVNIKYVIILFCDYYCDAQIINLTIVICDV